MNAFFTYLVVVNIVSAVLFTYDKVAAIRRKRRIPELVLHFSEVTGGVFFVVMLMYLINHKNRKPDYNRITYAVLIVWTVIAGWFFT